MEKNSKFYLGVDVSKGWLDLALLPVINHQKGDMIHKRFDNSAQGMKVLDRWLAKHKVPFNEQSIMVIESTGMYHRRIAKFCNEAGLPVYIGNPAHLKWSMGLARGKNDVVDCKRLCEYAYRHGSDLEPTPALDPRIEDLKDLITMRTGLLKNINSIQQKLRELKKIKDEAFIRLTERVHTPSLVALKKALKELEAQIYQTIASDEAMQKNYKLLLSVPGIGPVTAAYLLSCTGNFTGKQTGKQLASYAGVVPFGHQSGSRIKGRDRVHYMSNKNLKKLLHMAALSAIRRYPEFRDYFDRKELEGKHPLQILNNIKNKLVLRAVSVINAQTPYQLNMKKAA